MKRLYLILLLMSVSLIGIVVVQWLWIRNAVEVREENYDRDVREALSQTVNQLDKRRSMVFMSERMTGYLPDSISFNDIHYPADSLDRVINPQKMVRFFQEKELVAENKAHGERQVIREKQNTPREHQRLKRLRRDSMLQSMNVHMPERDSLREKIVISMNNQRMVMDSLKNLPLPDLEAMDEMELDMKSIYKELQKIDLETFRKQLEEQTRRMEDVFKEMALEYRMHIDSIHSQVPYEEIDTLLGFQLSQRGIQADYAYAVVDESGGKDSGKKILHQSPRFEPGKKKETYRTSLFPDDLIRKNVSLLLQIPRKRSLILQSISYLLIGSLIFTVVIIITFGITLHTLLRQKKLSDIKSDFINNMTHEFKTPIATISLAADSIANPKTLANKEGILHFLEVIKSENKRMNTQVERVLQMSLLDRQDFPLDMHPHHLHPMIEQVVNNTRVQLEKNGGTITYDPTASDDRVKLDQEHFLNILYNLVDNAIKYSGGAPRIDVRTLDTPGRLNILIEDQGVGIPAREQKRIFDKFYRISSGDVHNVKGFGLGLNYVKTMVEKFGGEIRVSSQSGRGTRFEILLPLTFCGDEDT